MSTDDDQGGDDQGALAVIQDALGYLSNSFPVVVTKNLLKAVSRLSSAATGIPVAYLEGKAAEIKATSKGRVKLLKTTADQLAADMKVHPEYVRAAGEKYAQKIVRERVNLDLITNIAIAEIGSTPGPEKKSEADSTPISDDWLNVFETEAANMSSEQMQRLFGKILAGEIRKPSSYSIKTVKLMAQLDNRAAALFRVLCSLAISAKVPEPVNYIDARVVSMGNANANSLQAFGLSFGELNILQEYGLIITDFNSYMDYQWSVVRNGQAGIATWYAGRQWVFAPKMFPNTPLAFQVHGVALSNCGIELLSIVDIQPNDAYTAALIQFFDQQGMTMTPL